MWQWYGKWSRYWFCIARQMADGEGKTSVRSVRSRSGRGRGQAGSLLSDDTEPQSSGPLPQTDRSLTFHFYKRKSLRSQSKWTWDHKNDHYDHYKWLLKHLFKIRKEWMIDWRLITTLLNFTIQKGGSKIKMRAILPLRNKDILRHNNIDLKCWQRRYCVFPRLLSEYTARQKQSSSWSPRAWLFLHVRV